ncbi:esterase-like activity of phytase family protein [uncultured Brevundimonas sp.]|uniref:esterase-like activity of phytase family protein n=1 Tax=uncultured Brevundimonas sp. TaxID=213418 RepID=UPI0026375A17|nr:esterase-like activity of phytase family protein [uncultured Brevundimonas sp.]
MNRKLYLSAIACLTLAACASAAITSQPWTDSASAGWTAQSASTRTVGLGMGGWTLGDGVTFAGGVQILTPTVSTLRSLSDLKLVGDDGFVAVSDAGDLVRGQIKLDEDGRLVGLEQFRSHRLSLTDGSPITQKVDGDAEGLAILPDGQLLVSFEREHRIWTYGPLDALQNPASLPRPIWPFNENGGMEAIAAASQDSWRVAGEDGGIWDCTRITCSLVQMPPDEPLKDSDYRITGMDRDPDGHGYWVVQRSFKPPLDARARVRHMAEDGTLGPVTVELKLPGTTDNFEGIAATKRGGKTRLYILSDDNENPLQRTLMLAFDVTP